MKKGKLTQAQLDACMALIQPTLSYQDFSDVDLVIEAVFVYPGLGQLMVDAVSKRDVPVIQACGLVFATVFVTLNTLADILVIVVNPRLRHKR